MNIEEFRDYCLSFKATKEEMPFGPDALVFKVGTKMFALTSFKNENFSFNIKNTPKKNLELREKHPFIVPGFHMSKKHWNTVNVEFPVSTSFLKELIRESYEIVVKENLSKKEKEALGV